MSVAEIFDIHRVDSPVITFPTNVKRASVFGVHSAGKRSYLLYRQFLLQCCSSFLFLPSRKDTFFPHHPTEEEIYLSLGIFDNLNPFNMYLRFCHWCDVNDTLYLLNS